MKIGQAFDKVTMITTYVGIGSCPHHETVEELTDAWDQLIPVFIRGKAAKIIHYDPAFEVREEFLNDYFEMKNFNKVDTFHWVSSLMEVILHPKRFEHPEDDHILEELAEAAIRTDAKLIVQEFTGKELTESFKAAYAKSSSPHNFKRNVLFDITYGNDCHCMTDMTKYRPLYNKHGDLINFLLYTEKEIHTLIGLSTEVNNLIKIYYVKKYLTIINLQVDYRRKLKGDGILFPMNGYSEESTPDEIMACLQSKIKPILSIFDSLGMMSPQKLGILESLLSNYRDYDVYKWNSAMVGLSK